MLSTDLQSKINNLKEVLKNFKTDVPLVGISLVRKGENHTSSDNYLADEEGIAELSKLNVEVIYTAIQNQIDRLDAILQPMLIQEAEEERRRQEEEAKAAESQRIKDEQAAAIKAQEDALKAAQETGRKLITMYLYDNSKLTLTTEQTLQQLSKFAAIKQLLELGSLRAAKELIAATEVDEIFTQERKDKYLGML